MKFGVCCIINELREKDIFTGRTCKRSTFTMDKASELALKNSKDLLLCLQYCVNNKIKAFRVGSDFFPRFTDIKYKFTDLKDHIAISNILREAGKYAHQNNMTLSCHPGPFTILGSLRPEVNESGILEVEYHSLLADLITQDVPNMQFAINIHVGCNFNNDIIPRFCSSFKKLSDKAKSRLTLENDDKKNGWSISKLYDIHDLTYVPLVFDLHHSSFSREFSLDAQQEFAIAKTTWFGRDWLQEIHISESADTTKNIPAHSDLIENKIPSWLQYQDNVYALFEAKSKEKSIFHYRQKFGGDL